MVKKAAPDRLFRGDDASVRIPLPKADRSLIRHVLHVGSDGRDTPYLSTSDARDRAAEFGSELWETTASIAIAHGAAHLRHDELIRIIKTSSTGRAHWHNSFERRQAWKFVELHREHLLDYVGFAARSKQDLVTAIEATFSRVRR